MIARCARCQGTFTTDRFGVQTCPHCGSEILLSDPGARPAPAQPPAPGAPWTPPPPSSAPPAPPAQPGPPPQPGPVGGPAAPAWGAPPPPLDAGRPPSLPPPPAAHSPSGSGPPAGGWIPPPPSGPPSFGGPLGGGPPGGGNGGPGDGGQPAPFAERATRGFFPAFFETFKLVATQPTEFFRRVRVDRPGSAVLFGVLAGTFGTVVSAVYSFLSMSAAMSGMREMVQSMPAEQGRFMLAFVEGLGGKMQLFEALLAPVLWFITAYVAAAVLHLLLLLFKGAPRGFDATLTTVGYSMGLLVLLALPVCGFIVAVIWMLVVVIVGLGEAQRCGPGKAAAAVFAPVLLFCACCCGAGVLGGAGAMKAIQQAVEAAKGQGTSL